jgi:uncharacterized radical SAM protein YgiQ
MHQGREVISRSAESLLREAATLVADPDFRGTITDVGGPTANTFAMGIGNLDRCRKCARTSCMYPKICSNLIPAHDNFLAVLKGIKMVDGVKHVFVASGIRHDLALSSPAFIDALARRYTGGHLKVAPEHVDRRVLALMRKPPIEVMEQFERRFLEATGRVDKEQYLVPYFIAGFPGCGPVQSKAASAWLLSRGQRLRQVQNFIPLPGTTAAAMYHTGADENAMPLHVAGLAERKAQKRALTHPGQKPSPGGKPGSNRRR